MSVVDSQFTHQDGVSLHQHIDETLRASRELTTAELEKINIRLKGIDKAVDLAYEVAEERRRGQNEWRDTLTDVVNTRATKEEVGKLEERVSKLELSRAEIQGKADQSSVNLATVFAICGVLFGLGSLVLTVLTIMRGG